MSELTLQGEFNKIIDAALGYPPYDQPIPLDTPVVLVEMTMHDKTPQVQALPAGEAVRLVTWDASNYCIRAKILAGGVDLGRWDRSL